jgi:hypothetical protein
LLVFFGLMATLALVVAAFVLGPLLRAHLVERRITRGGELSDAERCWMCGAESPAPIQPDVYRCQTCGSVQGADAPLFLRTRQRRQLAALSDAERLPRARAILEEARLGLMAVEHELQTAERFFQQARASDNDDGLGETRSRLMTGLLHLTQRARQLEDAALLLRCEPTLAPTTFTAFLADVRSELDRGYTLLGDAQSSCERLSLELSRQEQVQPT